MSTRTKARRAAGGRRASRPAAKRGSLPLYLATSMGFVALSLLAVLLLSLPRPLEPAGGPAPGPAPEGAQAPLRPEGRPGLEPLLEPASAAPAARGPAEPASYRPPVAPPPRPPRPPAKTLILVLDDAGHNLRELEPFLALPFPLTIAVLPGLPNSAEAARRVLEAGKELILHQPMEALGGAEPGPQALYLGASPEEAARLLEENLDSLPGARGLNNHMGSAVTRDPELMAAVLAVAQRRGIYYLDSLTAPDTATGTVAARERFRHWERDVFLDNSPDRVSIIRYIEEGKKKAEKGAPAVMIGHVWSAELAETLRELYPQLVEEGFSLSTISRFMLEEADARTRD